MKNLRKALLLSSGFLIATPAFADQIYQSFQLDSAHNVKTPGGPTLGTYINGLWKPYLPFTQMGASTTRDVTDKLKEFRSVRDFGAKCDLNPSTGVGTLDTVAIQAAINAVQATNTSGGIATSPARLRIPGSCLTGPLLISRPIILDGDASNSAELFLPAGSTAPLLTIAVAWDNSNYYVAGAPPAYVKIKGLTIASGNNADSAGATVAHGIAVTAAATNPVYTHVDFEDVKISHMPADGLTGAGFGANGYATGRDVYFVGNGRDNFVLNSVNDWRFVHAESAEAVRDNIVVSGTGGFECTNCNSYTAGRYNLTLYNPYNNYGPSKFIGGSIDTSNQHGVYFNYNGTNSPFLFIGTNFGNNGHTTVNTYSDIDVASGASNNLYLIGATFQPPHSVDSTQYSKYNIQFEGSGNVFTSSSAISTTWPLAFSVPSQVIGTTLSAAQGLVSSGPTVNGTTTVSTSTGSTGYVIMNGSGSQSATLTGVSGNNDNGQLQLINGGSPLTQITAYGASKIYGPTTVSSLGFTGPAPTVSACGGGTVAGTFNGFSVTIPASGSPVTSCTATFGSYALLPIPFPNGPLCSGSGYSTAAFGVGVSASVTGNGSTTQSSVTLAPPSGGRFDGAKLTMHCD